MEYEEILHRCFRCGYCKLPGNYLDLNCPSYLKYRFETFSPGGRMWLLRAWLDGKIEPGRRLQDIMFSCASCRSCVEHCVFPKFKDQLLSAFTAGREALIDQGKVPPVVRDCLTRLQSHGNPYGASTAKRADWATGLALEPYQDQEYLLFIGDVAGYDPRGQLVARSVASLLKLRHLSFGILGELETSDGNEARSMGETELADALARRNIAQFDRLGVKNVVTLSPHAFNTLKNDYPALGGQFQVIHYTGLLASQIKRHDYNPEAPSLRVTFHDPCYLGRHNAEYWPARILLKAMPNVTLTEMDRVMQNALCCGGGGGNLFTNLTGGGTETAARVRVREAWDSGAQVLITACPSCTIMLEDALKAEKLETDLHVSDLSEFLTTRLT